MSLLSGKVCCKAYKGVFWTVDWLTKNRCRVVGEALSEVLVLLLKQRYTPRLQSAWQLDLRNIFETDAQVHQVK